MSSKMENLVMSHHTARSPASTPSASEQALARLIVGLLLAITTPFLAPTALGALWMGTTLARGGHRVHAGAVSWRRRRRWRSWLRALPRRVERNG
jgi:hypothetical protein